MSENNCILCGNKAIVSSYDFSRKMEFECENCGKFSISQRLQRDKSFLDSKTKAMLSCLIKEYNLENNKEIKLVKDTLKNNDPSCIGIHEFLAKYPRDLFELLDRTLLNLSRLVDFPGDEIIIELERIKFLFFSKNDLEMQYVIGQLVNQNYIRHIESYIEDNVTTYPEKVIIEVDGWKRINELKQKPAGLLEQAFVAMWFDDSTNVIYNKGIKPAIEFNSNYKALRIDNVEHNNKICDQIIAEIKKSKFIVADFSGNRGGVYFEAGFAQGLGLPVIWLVNEKHIDNLHFDTRQYNHIVYSDYDDLKKKLIARIEATI